MSFLICYIYIKYKKYHNYWNYLMEMIKISVRAIKYQMKSIFK